MICAGLLTLINFLPVYRYRNVNYFLPVYLFVHVDCFYIWRQSAFTYLPKCASLLFLTCLLMGFDTLWCSYLPTNSNVDTASNRSLNAYVLRYLTCLLIRVYFSLRVYHSHKSSGSCMSLKTFVSSCAYMSNNAMSTSSHLSTISYVSAGCCIYTNTYMSTVLTRKYANNSFSFFFFGLLLNKHSIHVTFAPKIKIYNSVI